MAYINVSETGKFATLVVNTTSNVAVGATGSITVPAMTELTVTNSTGTYRWQQLDTPDELAITTVASNSLSTTVVLDPATFFGTGSGNTAAAKGLFNLSNDKTEVYFRVYFNGTSTGARYVDGKGYVSSLAPTVNPGAPVWTSPMTVEVNGSFTANVV